MRRSAFTLLEVLTVVVIMAILAAIILPQFSSTSEDAKIAAMKYTLHTLRSQIELYKMQHKGIGPDNVDNDTLAQLTSKTNADGGQGTGANYPYGPYIQGGFPVNPMDGKNTVSEITVFPPTSTTPAGGWFYITLTGQIAPNTAGHLND